MKNEGVNQDINTRAASLSCPGAFPDSSPKTYITMKDLMSQMEISDKTIHRMINDYELPDFTYGSRTSRKKGWHTAVLERHAIERYERSASKNISNACQVVTQNVSIVPLSNRDGTVPQKDRNFDNRNSTKKKLSRKKVPKHVRATTQKSRLSAGFSYSSR